MPLAIEAVWTHMCQISHMATKNYVDLGGIRGHEIQSHFRTSFKAIRGRGKGRRLELECSDAKCYTPRHTRTPALHRVSALSLA